MTRITKDSIAIRLSHTVISLVFWGLFALLFWDSDIAAQSLKAGLALCARVAIPSLFPFMIASELLHTGGLLSSAARFVGRPFAKLFSLPAEGGGSFLLGMLCGFPIGARYALLLYDDGILSARETERLLCFCNLPSSAFLIGTVGSSLFGDRLFGIFLYITGILSACLIGLLTRSTQKTTPTAPQYTKHTISPTAFTDAVSAATSAMLLIVSYILFFSAVIGVIGHRLTLLGVPSAVKTFLCGLLELTVGTNMASSMENRALGILFAAFFVGFGGISVHLQLFSFCGTRKLSKKIYLAAKLLQGILCAIASLFYLLLAPIGQKKEENITAFFPIHEYPKPVRITLILFLFCLALGIVSRLWQTTRRKNKKVGTPCVPTWSW